MAPSRLWAAGAGRESDPLASVLDHMYNLEFQSAHQLLESWLKQHPTDVRAWNYLAESILDQEMLNEGLLSTGAYLDRGEAFRRRSAPLRVSFEGELLGTLDKVQALAEGRLKQNPEDQEALYWAGVAHGTRAEFYFALSRSYHAAMHEGVQARRYEMRLARVNPRSADALLILGIADYAIGSLPWYLKVFVSVAGLRGNRARGIAEMERASQEGHWAREDAKFVLVAVYRREKMYDKALADLHLLAQSYPRNFVVELETARIHKDRDDWVSAARVYDELVSKLQSNEAGASLVPAPRILYLVSVAKREMPRQIRACQAFLLQIFSAYFDFFLDMYIGIMSYIQGAIQVRISG